MTAKDYQIAWWEENKEMKRLLRRTIVVGRSLERLEYEMAKLGIEKPRSKPKWKRGAGLPEVDLPW